MKIRVLPIAITGVALLFVLKASGLVLTGSYSLTDMAAKPSSPPIAVQPAYRPVAAARSANSWSRDSNNYDPIITGSVPPGKPDAPPANAGEEAKTEGAPAEPAAEAETKSEARPETQPDAPTRRVTDLLSKNPNDLSSAEKALLDRLQSRREELEAREGEMDLRESLLRAAEKKVEDRIKELKAVEERLAAIETARKQAEDEKIKDLVTMYENMKPKQAAAIFDRLDMTVLVEVTTRMDPKKTSDIIARMDPAAAERLTVALAKRELADSSSSHPDSLPKIGGATPR